MKRSSMSKHGKENVRQINSVAQKTTYGWPAPWRANMPKHGKENVRQASGVVKKTNSKASKAGRNHVSFNPCAYGSCTCCGQAGDAPLQICEDDSGSSQEDTDSMEPFHCGSPNPLTPPVICMTRGQQGLEGWWRMNGAEEVLGHLKECMQSFAKHCLLSAQASHNTTLRVLSLSDGHVNDKECVPTSVLLAHAFASLDIDALPHGLERIQIVGADVQNPKFPGSPFQFHWLPSWLELQHLHLDNTMNFKPQLCKFGKFCQHSCKFDIVLVRQGLCYCKDHSFDCLPPKTLSLVGIQGRDGFDGPSGTYTLEPEFRNGRPAYKKGKFLMWWRPKRHDWVVDDEDFVWANVVSDVGSPAAAKAPWYVWDGTKKDYVLDYGVSSEVEGPAPQIRACPRSCTCCAGINLHAEALQAFMARCAAVLDENQPKAFALLHSGHYSGFRDDVEGFQSELEKAAERFNSYRFPKIHATVLRKEDEEDQPTTYWKRINGLLLTPSHV